MRVDCGRFNGPVTEQNLDNCEIDAAFDQSGRVAVTKAMERGPADAGLVCGEGEGTAERPASDGPVAGLVRKKPPWVPVGGPELAQVLQNWLGQGDDPLFVTLADDPQLAIDAVDGRDLEGSSFTGTQATGVNDA
jgi:hypothetical protein